MPEAADGRSVGDLAIVLHSHMPYVEGYGTYPFGEEWLFDAVARSYLPLLDVVRDLTVTVTPVLADQLEAPGLPARLESFMRRHRLEPAEREAQAADRALRAAAAAEAARYRAGLARLDRLGGDLLAGFRQLRRERGVALMASAATHAVLPLVATAPGRRLQIDAGIRSHRRRFGWDGGFWLPECAYAPGLEPTLAESGVDFFCVDQSVHERGRSAPAPVATAAGPVAFPIDWQTIRRVWSPDGYPADGAYADFHRQSLLGMRLWSSAGGAYQPDAARHRARDHARDFVELVGRRLGDVARERGRAGLVVFAVDTELLGHWWTEGPAWLAAVLELAEPHGIRLVSLVDALAAHPAGSRELRPASWGEHKDLSTWDSREVADLAWAARRLELRLLRELAGGRLERSRAERAARELLALQSSDWAFLDKRGRAGDYAYQRAVNHARAMQDAIVACAPPDPRLRHLAPDMSLAPLAEP